MVTVFPKIAPYQLGLLLMLIAQFGAYTAAFVSAEFFQSIVHGDEPWPHTSISIAVESPLGGPGAGLPVPGGPPDHAELTPTEFTNWIGFGWSTAHPWVAGGPVVVRFDESRKMRTRVELFLSTRLA